MQDEIKEKRDEEGEGRTEGGDRKGGNSHH